MSRRTSEANKAILVAWNKEQELVREGEGTRDWTPEQQQDILDKGKAYDENARAFEGQHMKSAEKYPEYQGDPENIQFLTRAEHLEAHDGNWQNPTNWYFNPVTKEKLDFGDGSVIPCVIIQLTEPIVSIQLTQKDKNEESPTPVKFVDENKNEDTVGIEISHANLQSNNSKKVNLSEVGFGQNWKRRIKNIGKSILEFSAKHPKMTKMIKGASIVAAAIVTTKIAESTKSGASSSENGLSYDNENKDYTGYQSDEFEQEQTDLVELKSDRKHVDDPIDVTEHIRNLPEGWHASEKKIASAAEHGYNLQPGQTWVENYKKNKEE